MSYFNEDAARDRQLYDYLDSQDEWVCRTCKSLLTEQEIDDGECNYCNKKEFYLDLEIDRRRGK